MQGAARVPAGTGAGDKPIRNRARSCSGSRSCAHGNACSHTRACARSHARTR